MNHGSITNDSLASVYIPKGEESLRSCDGEAVCSMERFSTKSCNKSTLPVSTTAAQSLYAIALHHSNLATQNIVIHDPIPHEAINRVLERSRLVLFEKGMPNPSKAIPKAGTCKE